jgi:hypothetical protein
VFVSCECCAFCSPVRRVDPSSKVGLKFNAEFSLGLITNHGYQDLWALEGQRHVFLNSEASGREISTS